MKDTYTPLENVEVSVEVLDRETGDPKTGLTDLRLKVINPDDTVLFSGYLMAEVTNLVGVYRRLISRDQFTQLGKHYFEVTSFDPNVKSIRDSFYREPYSYHGISGTGGAGARAIIIEVLDHNSIPIEGVEVWLTNDSDGNNVVAGTLITDASGMVTFTLDPGNYYMWRQRRGVNFPNPKLLEVVPI